MREMVGAGVSFPSEPRRSGCSHLILARRWINRRPRCHAYEEPTLVDAQPKRSETMLRGVHLTPVLMLCQGCVLRYTLARA